MSLLLPSDDTFLASIFPNSKLASIDILANNYTTCTFKAYFAAAPSVTVPQDVVGRIETFSGVLEAVTALQKEAHSKIPGLIPKIVASGKASLADGRGVEYTITEFVAATETLESIWPSLDASQQEALMDEIVDAVKKLQDPTQSNTTSAESSSKLIGSSKLGYAPSMRAFLALFLASQQPKKRITSTLEEVAGGITITSSLPELGSIFLSDHDLQELDASVVLCHNDLEPRNILVRRTTSSSPPNTITYELAAIIDWEMAAHLPFAFEFAMKDSALGSSNLYYDWYNLFKRKTRTLIPDNDASRKLMAAVRIIAESRSRHMRKNVSKEFRRRWLEWEGVEWTDDVAMGWMKRDGVRKWRFDKKEDDQLETTVLRDFGRLA